MFGSPIKKRIKCDQLKIILKGKESINGGLNHDIDSSRSTWRVTQNLNFLNHRVQLDNSKVIV